MGLPLVLFVALGVAPPAGAAPAGLSYVQATVIAPGPAARSLSFVDASGRSRAHAVSTAAANAVGRLRPGDEVIVVLAGADPVIQDVRVSHGVGVAEPAAAPDAGGSAEVLPDDTTWTVVPTAQMRPTWPNPYSRFYTGTKPVARRAHHR